MAASARPRLCGIAAFMACALLNGAAWSQAWSLSDQQRRDYLGYYSPIIFKNADEDAGKHAGYDWITNFDFDRDGIRLYAALTDALNAVNLVRSFL